MTPRQVGHVQASFAKVAPIADQAAALFYRRLFETAPDVRALFGGDMIVQGQKLMSAIATVVDSLGDIDAVAPAARDLAKRHVAYGVRPKHYEIVGAAPVMDPGARARRRLHARGQRGVGGGLRRVSDIMTAAADAGS